MFTILFSGLAVLSIAQNPVVNQITEDLLESVGENMSDDTDIQEILDDLQGFSQNPLKINLASIDDLKRLHLLSEVQINNIVAYREKTGTIYSLFELVTVDGFTPDILQKLEPFISFDVLEEKSGKKRSSTDLLMRSNRTFSSSGQTDQTKLEGSPERYYFRMKHVSTRMEYGVVAEKDPGEAFFSQSNKQGFDYANVFANFRIGQKDNRIFVGGY
ncbi:helix-hairpin-helix domain-containing protein, partial [bacterium]|nr:helix-hairpin-helix domain-containing protein [bacterium]